MARGMTSVGPNIEYSRKALAVFSAKERAEVLKTSLEAAGNRWLEKTLPKRFDTGYMKRAPFSHHTSQLSLRQKIRKAIFQGQKPGRGRFDFSRLRPLIMSGRMYERSLTASTAKARGGANNLRVVIHVRLGHGVRKETADLIKLIPRREVDVIGNQFKANVVRIINHSTFKRTKTGKIATRGGIQRRTTSGVKATNTIRGLQGGF